MTEAKPLLVHLDVDLGPLPLLTHPLGDRGSDGEATGKP